MKFYEGVDPDGLLTFQSDIQDITNDDFEILSPICFNYYHLVVIKTINDKRIISGSDRDKSKPDITVSSIKGESFLVEIDRYYRCWGPNGLDELLRNKFNSLGL